MYDQARLRELLNRRRAGHSLEAAFYTSPEVFEADMQLIFGRHWIYVGLEAEVKEPGDVLAVDIGLASIIIVRDDDNALSAFHNVCRHRGARLVNAATTSVGNLVCPYHSWTYNLKGQLIFADHMEFDITAACHGLKRVHVASVCGLLHVCLAEEPPQDIQLLMADMAPYLEPHDLRRTKVAHSIDLIEHGNWKITMENNRECYHCSANHPELTSSIFAYGFGFAPQSLNEADRVEAGRYQALVEDSHRRWEGLGFASREIEHLADRATGYRTERLPLHDRGQSQTMDTAVACRRLLGDISSPAMGGLSFWTQPNAWHHFMSDHVVTFSVLPLAPDRTLLRTKWLVHEDAVEGQDYDVDNLTAVWRATNLQDSALVEITHAGVRSPAYEPGPYSPHTEGLVEKFQLWYLGRLGAELPA